MLYDPKWDKLPAFKSWVEKQPSDDFYPYCNSMGCACAQYLTSANEFHPDWLSEHVNVGINELARGPEGINDHTAWTFGKLLDRIDAKEKELI